MLLAKDLICLLYGFDRALLWLRKQGTRPMETAEMYLQTFPSEILAAAARGEVDLNSFAKAELASRGLDLQAKWVGFAEAARLKTQD